MALGFEYESPCSMPVEYLVNTLKGGLAAAGIDWVEVVPGDMWELPPEVTTPVIDEVMAGHDFPMVLVDNRIACMNGIDVEAVVQALSSEKASAN